MRKNFAWSLPRFENTPRNIMTDRIEKENIKERLRLTKRPLGQILVEGRFISTQDLDAALEEQKSTGEPLGEILVRMGTLDPTDLWAVLTAQKALASLEDAVKAVAGIRQPLGELLLRANRITKAQFELVYGEHKRSGIRLGEILVRLGYITSRELEALLEFQKYQGNFSHGSTKFRLGDILVATKRITQAQLEDALERQKLSKKKLGDVLVEAGYVKPRHVDHCLRLQDKLLTAALVAVLSLASASGAYAVQSAGAIESSSASVTVSAFVMPHANLKVVRQAHELMITNADILRGYVDVNAASLFQIKNNSPKGYMLAFESVGTTFKEVHIKGSGIDVVLTYGTGLIARPYAGKSPVTLELSYRFILSDEIAPGTYAWPLTASINQL